MVDRVRPSGIFIAQMSTPCGSGVAQLAERVAVNHLVVGSSPTAGAKKTPGR